MIRKFLKNILGENFTEEGVKFSVSMGKILL